MADLVKTDPEEAASEPLVAIICCSCKEPFEIAESKVRRRQSCSQRLHRYTGEKIRGGPIHIRRVSGQSKMRWKDGQPLGEITLNRCGPCERARDQERVARNPQLAKLKSRLCRYAESCA
jgi:hypothetical protein